MIDVIITCFNSEASIEQCCLSIPKKILGHDVRLIVCDDASNDGTVDIVKHTIGVFDLLIEQSKNIGVAFNRQTGLAKAEGEYVMFIDSDDIINYEPSSLEITPLAGLDLVVLSRCIPTRRLTTENLEALLLKYGRDKVNPTETIFYLCNKLKTFLGECWGYLYKRDLIVSAGISFKNICILEDVLFLTDFLKVCSTWSYSSEFTYVKSTSIGIGRGNGNTYYEATLFCLNYLSESYIAGLPTRYFLIYINAVKKRIAEELVVFTWSCNFTMQSSIAKLTDPMYANTSCSNLLILENRLCSFVHQLKHLSEHADTIFLWQVTPLSIALCKDLSRDTHKKLLFIDDARHSQDIILDNLCPVGIYSYDHISSLTSLDGALFIISTFNIQLSKALMERSKALFVRRIISLC